MMPRDMATEAQLRKKQKAFNELRMTSHWSLKSILFGKQPRTYGAELPPIRETDIQTPHLSELGRRIAGFEQ
jgi:hypothetical protein